MNLTKLNPNDGLRVFDIRRNIETAGPSPNDNKRIEVFLLGCNKAMKGKACKGCFNSVTWDKNKAEWSFDPIELADMINSTCDPNNKYITIGGGEPTDQLDKLILFTKRLKEHGFHILVYTWRTLKEVLDCSFEYIMPTYIDEGDYKHRLDLDMQDLLSNIDILVDGEYKEEECLYQEKLGDGMLSSVGSGNQIIWDIKLINDLKKKNILPTYLGYRLDELAGLYVKPNTNDLVYITKE